ncbi:hypothetical protein [Streptomyces racemochromogenes]|uniref:hypothetical protein n=1 Tax=Streptomyces racemochromogenes TaxID=67353 RepID=UPI0031E53509
MDHDRPQPAAMPLSDEQAAIAAYRLIQDAYTPAAVTSYRDTSPLQTVGSASPVAQPGRPPMSQRATDASALMLTAGIVSIPIGGSLSLVLYTLGGVDPAVIGLCVAGGVLVLGGIAKVVSALKAVVEAAPPAEQHHHYNAPVHQEHHSVSTETRGLIAKTVNRAS